MLTVDLYSVYLLPSVDIVIRYIEIDFMFVLRIMFVISNIRYIEVRYIEVLFHTLIY